MLRRRSLAAAVFTIGTLCSMLLLCTGIANANIPFQTISQDELKMTSEPMAPGASAIILYREVNRDDNALQEEHYIRIKILTEEGRKYANIEIPFDSISDHIRALKARTIRSDGTIINFDGKFYDKTVVKAKGLKFMARTFTLPDVEVGGIIEYSYTVDLEEGVYSDSRWLISQELFTKNAQFSLRSYSYAAIRWSFNLPPGAAQPYQKKDNSFHLEVANIPAFVEEDYMPPVAEMQYHVDFLYFDVGYQSNDVTKRWQHIGKNKNAQMEAFIDKRSSMREIVSHIVTADESPEAKAQKIYARVQQLRNTSYEIQKTGQEQKRAKEKEVNNVEDVWKNGGGSGYDLTWLYLALAKAAGIDAYGALVANRGRHFFDPAQEKYSLLNANVVMLHFADKDVFCDPGADHTPYGLLPWQETNTAGMLLNKDGGKWIKTPLPDSSVSRIERNAKLKLSEENGSLEGKLTVTFTGLEAVGRRVDERNEDVAAQKKFLEDEVKEWIPMSAEVELTNAPDWKGTEQPLVAEFTLKIEGWAEAAGRRTLLAPGIFGAPEKHLFEHANRTYQIYYHYPSSKLDDITIELPEGWQVSALPPQTVQDLSAVNFTAKAEIGKDGLHLQRKLTNDIFIMDPKFYPALQIFYRLVRTNDEKQIVLIPGAPVATN